MNTSNRLERLVYTSRAAEGIADADMYAILGVSRMLNRRRDLTGLLIFTGSHFLQVLEGRDDALNGLMVSLARDRRHVDIRTLGRTPTSQRHHESWAMGVLPGADLSDTIRALHESREPLAALLDSVEQELSDRARRAGDDAASGFWPI